MDNNIIGFPGYDLEDILAEEEMPQVAVDKVFQSAAEREFDDVTILGRLTNGGFYFATTSGDLANVNWDLDRAKNVIMSVSQMVEEE